MGYFNPFSYFIKSFIRIFTKKFFWVFLILICLFLGFILFNINGVFAESNFYFDDSYFTSADVERCQNLTGNIWNNSDYDIFVFYHASRINRERCYMYFDTSSLSDNTVYRIGTSDYSITNGCYVVPFWFYDKSTETQVGNYVTDYVVHELYNDWGDSSQQWPPSSNPNWRFEFV